MKGGRGCDVVRVWCEKLAAGVAMQSFYCTGIDK